jgi:hypothetical protein
MLRIGGNEDEQNNLKGKYAAAKKSEIDQKKRIRTKKRVSQATAQGGVRWNVCQISTGRHE